MFREGLVKSGNVTEDVFSGSAPALREVRKQKLDPRKWMLAVPSRRAAPRYRDAGCGDVEKRARSEIRGVQAAIEGGQEHARSQRKNRYYSPIVFSAGYFNTSPYISYLPSCLVHDSQWYLEDRSGLGLYIPPHLNDKINSIYQFEKGRKRDL